MNTIEIEARSEDELLEKLYKKYEKIDDEILEQITQIFDDEKQNQSLNKYNIKHWVSNRSFGELIDMYENHEIKKPCKENLCGIL